MISAPDVSHANHPIYPSYCHRLSPTIGKWCPVLARDVVALREVDGFEGQNIFFHLNHPIKYVKLTGIVVAVDEFAGGKNGGRVVITIDDSSGTNIECTCAAPPKTALVLPSPFPSIIVSRATGFNTEPATETGRDERLDVKGADKDVVGKSPDGPSLVGVEIGSVLKVKGGVGVFRGMKQVLLKRIEILKETNKEVAAWKEVVAFQRDVLGQPWVVGTEDEDTCRAEDRKDGIWKREEEKRRRRGKTRDRAGTGTEFGNLDEKARLRVTKTQERKQEDRRTKNLVKEKGLNLDNEATYPSKVARMRAAGKYDALGI